MEAEIGVPQAKEARECGYLPEVQRGREEFAPRTSMGTVTLLIP